MKFLKYMAIVPLGFAAALNANAQTISSQSTIPFSNAEIAPASFLKINYKFDPHTQRLYCHDAHRVQEAYAAWTYKNTYQYDEFPISLMDDAKFPGKWADPEGKLYIFNKSTDQTMSVTCNYLSW